jgi:23S rRNA (uracil1939-C5)-methyltransferase
VGGKVAASHPPSETIEVEVMSLGSDGDGLAASPFGTLYLPGTLPGERVRVRLQAGACGRREAEVVALLAPAAARAEPPCRHFGHCGGCALQHLGEEAYAAFKCDRLTTALARAGVAAATLRPLQRTSPAARRRANLKAARENTGNVRLGFHQRRSWHIVTLAECPVLAPALVTLLPRLRAWLAHVLAPGERVALLASALCGGVDVVFTRPAPLSLAEREGAAAFARDADLARLSWRAAAGQPAEPIVQRRPVGIAPAGVFIATPPGCFVQPSAAGEAALLAAVREGVGEARRIADLFAGVGTFAVPLAQSGRQVLAVDADATALAAARRAAPQLATEVRDLAGRPLLAGELCRFDAVIFDPPRAGAAAQAREIAAAGVPVVVAVSCNPATFARDAARLQEGGYALDWVQPIDQFLWSPHLELVALFRRGRAR